MILQLFNISGLLNTVVTSVVDKVIRHRKEQVWCSNENIGLLPMLPGWMLDSTFCEGWIYWFESSFSLDTSVYLHRQKPILRLTWFSLICSLPNKHIESLSSAYETWDLNKDYCYCHFINLDNVEISLQCNQNGSSTIYSCEAPIFLTDNWVRAPKSGNTSWFDSGLIHDKYFSESFIISLILLSANEN